jgi:DNA invertase Pin-like site-specific DNA recombinase
LQAEEGASLDAQAVALTAAATAAGYEVEIVREEGRSGKNITGRPELLAALDRLARGEAAALFTQRLDRLSRSVADFAALHAQANKQGWTVVCLDIGVDTSTPSGEFMANVMASMSQYERRIISARTRDALAQRRREGVRLGRPPVLPAEVITQIDELREVGESLRAIATHLNAQGTATAHGGQMWHASTVQKVLNRQAAA